MRPGAIAGDTTTAFTFAGNSNSRVIGNTREQNRNTVSVEAWVRTTSNQGGWIVGFGNSASLTGTSSNRDRQLYMESGGRVQFGVQPRAEPDRAVGRVLQQRAVAPHRRHPRRASGMNLYVDGVLVGSRTDTTTGRNMSGFWRIGGDSLSGWPNQPSSSNLAGTIDEVAIYPSELTAGTVAAHNTLGRTGAAPNQPPVAAFTSPTNGLAVDVDGSTSADPDGAIASYAWTYGDGGTATGANPAAHTYSTAGTYTVTLTVTDDEGATGVATRDVTVAPPAPNQPPVAAFTATPAGLSVTVDGSGSSDPDGTVASYAWTFGDGGTATGPTPPAHAYAAEGTYTVTLTVTDDDGAPTTLAKDVTVTAPPANAPFAADTFNRTTADGWGSAETGGAWTVAGGATNFSVAPNIGTMRVTGAGFRLSSFLPVSTTSTDLTTQVSMNVMPTGSGTDLELVGRSVGTTDGYRLRLKMLSTGVVRASLVGISGRGDHDGQPGERAGR